MQEQIGWIRKQLPDEYFSKIGIPNTKINEFIEFSILEKPEIKWDIKTKSIGKITMVFENTFPKYVRKLK